MPGEAKQVAVVVNALDIGAPREKRRRAPPGVRALPAIRAASAAPERREKISADGGIQRDQPAVTVFVQTKERSHISHFVVVVIDRHEPILAILLRAEERRHERDFVIVVVERQEPVVAVLLRTEERRHERDFVVVVVERQEPVPFLAVAEDREEGEGASVDIPPRKRKERQVVAFLPKEQRKERVEITVVPHDGEDVEVMLAPEHGEDASFVSRGVVLSDWPEEVMFRAVVRVEGTEREMIVRKGEHRPEHGAHRLAPVGDWPEVHAILGLSRIGDVVSFVERRRLHLVRLATGKQHRAGHQTHHQGAPRPTSLFILTHHMSLLFHDTNFLFHNSTFLSP